MHATSILVTDLPEVQCFLLKLYHAIMKSAGSQLSSNADGRGREARREVLRTLGKMTSWCVHCLSSVGSALISAAMSNETRKGRPH